MGQLGRLACANSTESLSGARWQARPALASVHRRRQAAGRTGADRAFIARAVTGWTDSFSGVLATSQVLATVRQEAAGRMFWFTRKRFFGSYFAFTDARRL